ncbi:MFS general substrate transporter [Aspergillus sclerotiicarbonarius CBS 121057]|uniref:MFS general substrate transporter n=1 Tax=Aspergillus sclerotiicarbonarius (strain CBS 121057 / IBT 28362) TaxID=1448318 RepID=A0A319DRZ4_ASPSB|nr:MFS general substrate transporter [Aspergillus sclerotiicarbonarius CBS 121057]
MSSPQEEKDTSRPDDNMSTGVGQVTFSEEEERGVVRKIDCFILPMVSLMILLVVPDLDKQSLSYASVFGLIEDLSLKGSEYSCIIWGCICMCLAATHNFAGFAAVRFLLGFSEGAVSPAFVTLTSVWYQKKEHASRIGIWVTMNGLAQVLGSLLMYGIGKTAASHLAPWRILFIICGALTSGLGVLFLFGVPSTPEQAWVLTPREREVLLMRMTLDRDAGDLLLLQHDQTDFSMAQAKETVMDLRSWSVFLFGILATMQSPVLTFASLIISNLNYDKLETMLCTSPSGAVQILAIWVGIFGCFILPRNRCVVVIFLTIPPLIGNILLLKLPISAGWGLIMSSWLASCISNVMAILLSLSASNVKENTKRPMANTFYFIGYSVGCIAAPHLWKSNAAPRYFEGIVTAIVTWCLLILVMCFYWYLCWAGNANRDRTRHSDDEPSYRPGDNVTDIQDLHFRYSY